jgi:hypothetical protein
MESPVFAQVQTQTTILLFMLPKQLGSQVHATTPMLFVEMGSL